MPKGPHLTGGAVRVEGLAELQRAFRRIDSSLGRETRKTLREMVEPVRARARANVQHKTGRHDAGGLAGSVRIGVSARAVSVYSNKPHAAVQDLGGRVGHGAVITRASASAYMTKAVQQGAGEFETQLLTLGDRIADKFGGRA